MSDEAIQNLILILTLLILPFCVGLVALITWMGVRGDKRRRQERQQDKAREQCAMALSNEPVYFCDPHHKDGKKVIGEHYVIHFEGPRQERVTYAVDVCTVEDWGKSGHDQTIQTLLSFLKENGTKVPGAELILPGDRKVIGPAAVFHPELQMPSNTERDEEPKSIPTPFFSEPGKPEPTPTPPPIVSPFPSGMNEGETTKKKKKDPPTFYEYLQDWAIERGLTISDVAIEMGYASGSTLYRWRNFPPGLPKMRGALKALGLPANEVERVALLYGGLKGGNAVDDPTPGLDEVIKTKLEEPAETKPRIPKAVTEGERAGGLHRSSIYGEGQTRGSNPILGIA